MDKLRLLKAVYEAIDWARLYENAPEAERRDVDELFRQLREGLGPQAEQALADQVRGGEAVLRCDGASKGNPGPAGAGMVIETADGREVLAWGEPVGRATNNVAEYRALLAGLQKALEIGVHRIEVRADSELLVRQINGDYRVKSAKLRPLHAQAMSLLERFGRWSVRHVPRQKNARADTLADEAARQAGQ